MGHFAVMSAAAAFLAACTNVNVGACVPGRSESCVCAGGAPGVQVCQEVGTFGPCDCGQDGGAGDGGADGGVTNGTLDLGITFRPAGFAQSIDCVTALVSTVRLQLFEPGSQQIRTEISRPCVASDRYSATLEPGSYTLKVQGLNGQQTICYEAEVSQSVVSGETSPADIVAEQHPTGVQGGCQYPGAPPP